MSAVCAFLVACLAMSTRAAYSLTREYSGKSFFDRWDFIDAPDLSTHGDVLYRNRSAALSEGLVSVNPAGHAIIKVDNTTDVPYKMKRNSVRVESPESYGVGSLFMIDLLHIPYGCSVWPAFWTRGTGPGKWPDVGEIDIIEGVNARTFNQMVLHTNTGCTQASGAQQLGTTMGANCAHDGAWGCAVQETKANSYGQGFAQAGGGVFAAQLDESGVFMWFWSRPDVPASITGASSANKSMEMTDWGVPSAAFPSSSCNVTQHFMPQHLVFTITLCGDFATPEYSDTCGTPKVSCTADNVFGPGSPSYDNAYFEIQWLRIYSADSSTNLKKALSATELSSTGDSSGSNMNATFSKNDQKNAGCMTRLSMPLVIALFLMLACLL